MPGIKDELVAVSEYVFSARIRPRLEGITDGEYFWEPVPGCWSLRPDPDGVFRLDTARLVPPDRQPFTTLAWRLWHLIGCYGGKRNATWLGVEPAGGAFDEFGPAPPTAAAALDALDSRYSWWSSMLRSLTDKQLAVVLGPIAGEYAEATRAAFVLHQLDEVIHHGSETALMRDLYREQVTRPTGAAASLIEAAAGGYWADARARVSAGDDVTVTRPDDFNRTALHHAAAGGPPDVVRALVEAGADLMARDTQFNATPLGWAEYFGREDIAAYLREASGAPQLP